MRDYLSPLKTTTDFWGQNLGGGVFRVNSVRDNADYSPDSTDFFDWSEYQRYIVFFPWLKSALGMKASAGKDVLEIGFGLGVDLLSFARRGANTWGIELSPKLIELTRRRFKTAGYSCRLARADARQLPFPDASFSLIYSFDVFPYLPSMEAAVDEIHRVLRPGGEAIIGFFNKNSLTYWNSTIISYMHNRFKQQETTSAELFSKGLGLPMQAHAVSSRKARGLFGKFGKVSLRVYRLSLVNPEKTTTPQSTDVTGKKPESTGHQIVKDVEISHQTTRLIDLGGFIFRIAIQALSLVMWWLSPLPFVLGRILTPTLGQMMVIKVTK